MYNYIKNPKDNKDFLLRSPAGKKLLKSYIRSSTERVIGGSSGSSGENAVQPGFKPITALEYLELDALNTFSSNMDSKITEYLNIYITIEMNQISEIQPQLHLLGKTSKLLLKKFLVQGFCISLSKAIYMPGPELNEYIELLKELQNYIKDEFMNSLKTVNPTEALTKRPVEIERPIKFEEDVVTQQVQGLAYGGGNAQLVRRRTAFRNGTPLPTKDMQPFDKLKDLLEVIAEPKHDFGGDRSGECVGISTTEPPPKAKITCLDSGGHWVNTVKPHFTSHPNCKDVKFNGLLTNELQDGVGIKSAWKFWNSEVSDRLISVQDAIQKNHFEHLASSDSSLKKHYENAFPQFRECLNRNGGNMEPQLFATLFMNNQLIAPEINGQTRETDKVHYNKFQFFSVNWDKGSRKSKSNKPDADKSFMLRIINSDKEEFGVKFPTKFNDYLYTILKANRVKNLVFDTSAGIEGWSSIKDYITDDTKHGPEAFKILVPLVNLWDPASTSVDSYKKSKGVIKAQATVSGRTYAESQTDSLLASNTYMDGSSTYSDWSPNRTGEISYTISENVGWDTQSDRLPIKLTISYKKHSQTILLKKGFSVNSLSSILKGLLKIHKPCLGKPNFTSSHLELPPAITDHPQSDDNETLIRFKNALIKLVDPTAIAPGADGSVILNKWKLAIPEDSLVKSLITLILDMKKSGDWGLVKWVKQWNAVSANAGRLALFISGDKLCALMSILNGNPTLFGNYQVPGQRLKTSGWRKYSQVWGEDAKKGTTKLIGLYRGSSEWGIANIRQEIKYIWGLFNHDFGRYTVLSSGYGISGKRSLFKTAPANPNKRGNTKHERISGLQSAQVLKALLSKVTPELYKKIMDPSDNPVGLNEMYSDITSVVEAYKKVNNSSSLLSMGRGAGATATRAWAKLEANMPQRDHSIFSILFEEDLDVAKRGIYIDIVNRIQDCLAPMGEPVGDNKEQLKPLLKALRLIPEILLDLNRLLSINLVDLETALNEIVTTFLETIQGSLFPGKSILAASEFRYPSDLITPQHENRVATSAEKANREWKKTSKKSKKSIGLTRIITDINGKLKKLRRKKTNDIIDKPGVGGLGWVAKLITKNPPRRTSRVNKALSGDWIKTFRFGRSWGEKLDLRDGGRDGDANTGDAEKCDLNMNLKGNKTSTVNALKLNFEELIAKDILISKLDYQFLEIPNIYKKIIENLGALDAGFGDPTGGGFNNKNGVLLFQEAINTLIHCHFSGNSNNPTGDKNDQTSWQAYDNFMGNFINDGSRLKNVTGGIDHCLHWIKCLKNVYKPKKATQMNSYNGFISQFSNIANVLETISETPGESGPERKTFLDSLSAETNQ